MVLAIYFNFYEYYVRLWWLSSKPGAYN